MATNVRTGITLLQITLPGSQISIGTANMEASRNEDAAQKCAICKAKAVLHPSDDQIFPCSHSNNVFRVRSACSGMLLSTGMKLPGPWAVSGPRETFRQKYF